MIEIADPTHPSLDHAPARVEYEYDVYGNRIKERLLNASGVELHADRFGFDSTGQMAWHHSSYEDNSFAHLFTYGRDAAGNLTNILSSTAGGASTVLTYDELNRLSKVYVQDGGVIEPAIASYTYDNVGSLSAVNYANGIEHAYTYNALNRLTNLTHWVTDPVSSLKSPVSSLSYTLDARGYRTQIVEASGRESHYQYDTLGRLTREYLMGDPTVANGAADYTYDKVGNRLSRTSSGFMPANQDFTYNENDWLDSDTYDSNGNTTVSLAPDPQTPNLKLQTSDTYDFRNRLIRRTYDSGLMLDYSYNARGTRIGKAKRIGGALVNRKLFVVDDQNLTGYVQTLEEWTADGYDAVELDKVYDYGLDLVSQTGFVADPQTSNFQPQTSYFLYDGHGSVRALADETGTITDTYTYDAFGIQLSQTGSTDNAYRYCGEYFDADLGLYYLRARHMNPETGRFHTMDTYEGRLGEPLSLHKYMYAHANPVMGSDPSGHFTLAGLMTTIRIASILSNITIVATWTVFKVFGNNDFVTDNMVAWSECMDRKAINLVATVLLALEPIISISKTYLGYPVPPGHSPFTSLARHWSSSGGLARKLWKPVATWMKTGNGLTKGLFSRGVPMNLATKAPTIIANVAYYAGSGWLFYSAVSCAVAPNS